MQRLMLILSPHLDRAERVYAARRVLAKAGQKQPSINQEVICLCGLLLDLTLPVLCMPVQRRQALKAMLEYEPATLPLPRIPAPAAAAGPAMYLAAVFRGLIPGQRLADRRRRPRMSLVIFGPR